MARLSGEELSTLQDAFTRLLADKCTEEQVRSWMEDRKGYDPTLWKAMSEMGLTSLLVEERHGGAGAGIIAVERVMEQAGSALLGAPLLASAVMSVAALQASGDEDAQSRLLPQLASGSLVATLLITSPEGDWTGKTLGISAERRGDDWVLSGASGFVLHGRGADCWIAVANTDSGPALFEIEPSSHGATCLALPSFDHTLVLDKITLTDTPARQIGDVGSGWQSIQHALDLGLVALAGEQAGGAQRILDITVDYANIRHQFGRPIGSFQAVKHMAADLIVEVESAISAARQAAEKTDDGADDAPAWRYLAGFSCADAFVRSAADAVQMHGGIAFTWEHVAHLYLRRSRADQQLLGSSNYLREQYLCALGG